MSDETEAWTYDPITGEPIIHLGPNDDATEQEALGDPWEWGYEDDAADSVVITPSEAEE